MYILSTSKNYYRYVQKTFMQIVFLKVSIKTKLHNLQNRLKIINKYYRYYVRNTWTLLWNENYFIKLRDHEYHF